jgi:ribosomal protein S1
MLSKNDIIKVEVLRIKKDEIEVKRINSDKNEVFSIPKSEIRWSKQIPLDNPNIEVGTKLNAIVLFAAESVVYLSLKRATINPFILFNESFQQDDVVEVIPVSLFDFGMFVKTIDNINGLIHKVDIPKNYVFNNEKISARLISKDAKESRILLKF